MYVWSLGRLSLTMTVPSPTKHLGIPPCAAFHELALLCHEHSLTHKLPLLDAENSVQSTIEKKAEEKHAAQQTKIHAARLRRSKGGDRQNAFFRGMTGDKLTEREERYYQLLEHYQDKYGDGGEDGGGVQQQLRDEGWFCLPCNIKDEVYSKPPSYRHVHSNQYDPNHKPPKIESRGERCHCVGFCGRLLFELHILVLSFFRYSLHY